MKLAAKSVLTVMLVMVVCGIACAGSEQELYVGWAVSVLGEKDEHVCVWEVAADDFSDDF